MNKPPIFSIVVLVYNEEKNIGKLLDRLIILTKNNRSEIIIVDSGSIDRTVKIVRFFSNRMQNLHLFQIKHSDFSFGKTRNYATSIAKGKYVCFVSADALPENNFLPLFLEDFNYDKNTVAVYGKEKPRRDVSYFFQLEITNRFDELIKHAHKGDKFVVQNMGHMEEYNRQQNTFLLYFLSNVFACYKKNYLSNHPFREEGFEDIISGKELIEKGYTKIYDFRCIVTHSHNYSPIEYFFKQRDEYLIRRNYNLGSQKNSFLNKLINTYSLEEKLHIKVYYLIEICFYYVIKTFVVLCSKLF